MRTVTLRKSKYAKLYSWVIEDIRDRYGIIIRHKSLKTFFGHYSLENRVITIDKQIAGTIFGLFFLFHELRHMLHEINGLHPEFYRKILYGDVKGLDIQKIVWKVELDCCRFSVAQLEKLGVESTNQFCDEKYIRRVILPVWVDYYTPKNNS